MASDVLYEAMKLAAKKRKIKASPRHDLYKRVDPYFFNVFYDAQNEDDLKTENVNICLDIGLKYCRFDELRNGIINPGDDYRFTDKIRANSVIKCPSDFPRMTIPFSIDCSEKGLERLCEDILDYIEDFYTNLFQEVREKYGSLEEYYIAHSEEFPLLAGLVYIERKQYYKAETCFRHPNMPGQNMLRSCKAVTDEQKRRLEASENRGLYRSDASTLLDYTITMQKGLEWRQDLAKFGLLPEERQ